MIKALINLQATVAIIAAPVPAVKITPNPSIIFEANKKPMKMHRLFTN